MAAYAGDKSVFLAKKFGGVLFLVLGLLLAATGLANDYRGLTTIGALLLAIGAFLLVLKIVRRNQGS